MADSTSDHLKSTLWYTLGQYIDAYTLTANLNATPQFVAALTELVWTQIANTAKDLETFAKHAGRNVVNVDDVMLLARRNDELEAILRRKLDEIRAGEGRPAGAQAGPSGGTGKKRGRPVGSGKGKGKAKAT